MIYLEEVEAVQAGTEAIKAISNGKLDTILEQAISLGINAGKSILLAIIIFIVGRYIIKLINKLIANMLERRHVEPTIQSFLKSFINILLTILLVITVISALGVNTTSFAALLASAGVAVGMALSGNLQNLAGGIILLLFKPYKIGDFIDAQGVSGFVQEIQIFHTIIVTYDNKQIFIPNGALSSGSITNFSSKEQRRVDWVIGVEYGTDVEKVRAALMKIIDSDDRILKDPAPFIAVHELASSSVDFAVRVWVNVENYWGVYYDTNKQIYEEFNRQGIGFPFPQIQVHQS